MHLLWFLIWLSGAGVAVAYKGLYWTEESSYARRWHENDPWYGWMTFLLCCIFSWVALILMMANMAFQRRREARLTRT